MWVNELKKKNQSQHCHHKHKQSQLKKKKKKSQPGIHRAFSKTTPLTAAETEGCARNTRKTSNPLWLRVFIPQQCLSIFFMEAKNPVLSLFLAGTFMSWLVLTRNQLNGNHLQMYLSFIAHDCNCFPPRLKPASWSYGLLFWDSSRTISFTICLCSNMDGKRVTAQVTHCITASYFNSWWGFKPRRYYPKTEQQNDK